jgi:release factor glutamine methyltransferase
MRNSKEVFSEIISSLNMPDPGEKHAIARIVMEDRLGVAIEDILVGAPVIWDEGTKIDIQQIIARLNASEPVQYVTGFADFHGKKFHVNPNVLIPRPETEELVNATLDYLRENQKTGRPRILDIGTGSGCIAVTLAVKTGGDVFGTDSSTDALAVAAKNASLHNVHVTFMYHNIIKETLDLHELDVLVSNPPYICNSESSAMDDNVRRFEPHQALFVPDDDPLLFYRVIALKAKKALKKNGLLIFEINERYGREVCAILSDAGFPHADILKDTSGKERIVRSIQP